MLFSRHPLFLRRSYHKEQRRNDIRQTPPVISSTAPALCHQKKRPEISIEKVVKSAAKWDEDGRNVWKENQWGSTLLPRWRNHLWFLKSCTRREGTEKIVTLLPWRPKKALTGSSFPSVVITWHRKAVRWTDAEGKKKVIFLEFFGLLFLKKKTKNEILFLKFKGTADGGCSYIVHLLKTLATDQVNGGLSKEVSTANSLTDPTKVTKSHLLKGNH